MESDALGFAIRASMELGAPCLAAGCDVTIFDVEPVDSPIGDVMVSGVET
jgi:hypothetical protein